MSEMLEKVATAVKQHIHAEIEADVRVGELTSEELRGIVGAALLALREPTEGMVDAGIEAFRDGTGVLVARRDPPLILAAMIDSILSPDTETQETSE